MWDWPLFLLVFAAGVWFGYAVERAIDWWKKRKR